jgi:hypothetical protein
MPFSFCHRITSIADLLLECGGTQLMQKLFAESKLLPRLVRYSQKKKNNLKVNFNLLIVICN